MGNLSVQDGQLAQSVEQWPEKPRVRSSILRLPTIFPLHSLFLIGFRIYRLFALYYHKKYGQAFSLQKAYRFRVRVRQQSAETDNKIFAKFLFTESLLVIDPGVVEAGWAGEAAALLSIDGIPAGLGGSVVQRAAIPALARYALKDACMATNPRTPTLHDIEELYAGLL